MSKLVARGLIALGILPAFLVGALVAVPSGPAAAASKLAIDWTVSASTHLQKLNMTVTPPPGSFRGKINLKSGALTGHLKIPPAQMTIDEAGIGLAEATFEVKPTAPIKGKVNLSTFDVTTTSSFRVLVPSVQPLGLPVNLVPSGCGTATPVTLTLSGKANLTGSTTFTGTYTIPRFSDCGALTVPFDALVSGPNNTFTATFAPKSS
jgi:hypothetical protein